MYRFLVRCEYISKDGLVRHTYLKHTPLHPPTGQSWWIAHGMISNMNKLACQEVVKFCILARSCLAELFQLMLPSLFRFFYSLIPNYTRSIKVARMNCNGSRALFEVPCVNSPTECLWAMRWNKCEVEHTNKIAANFAIFLFGTQETRRISQ